MDVSLPILSWKEVWNDVGKQYPTLAGTAYLMWATWGMRVGSCLYYTVASRHKDRWKQKHETQRYTYIATHGRVFMVSQLENTEHYQKAIAELEKEFAGDPKVLDIVQMLKDGMTQAEIARQLGVSREAINKHIRKVRRSKRLQDLLCTGR